MKVLFSASLKIDFGKAKTELVSAYPGLSFSSATSLLDLERTLVEAGISHYTELPAYDFTPVEARLTQLELDKIRDDRCEELPNPEVRVPPGFDYCDTPDESIEAPDVNVDAFIAEIESMAAASEADIKSVIDCVGTMQDIAKGMADAITKRTDASNLLGNLEELLYNYRVLDAYHQKRLDTLQSVTDTFAPLTKKVNTLWSQLTTATSDDEKAIIQTQLDAAGAQLSLVKSNYPEFSEMFTDELGTNFREPVLRDRINAIRAGGTNVSIATFTTKTKINSDAQPNATSIKADIRFNYTDEKGLLSGKDTTFADGLLPFPADETPHGTLYDELLNIIGDNNQMFSAEERGLSTDRTHADPELAGAGEIDGMVVADGVKFKAFYSDFPNRHSQRVQEKKTNIIEPALAAVTSSLTELARTEVLTLLAYEQVYAAPPSTSDGILNAAKAESTAALSKSKALREAIKYLQQMVADADAEIAKSKEAFEQVECAQKHLKNKTESQPSTAPGSDPLGIVSLSRIKADDPDPTKQCWWLVFSALATAVGVIPIPGNGGFKYWPVGLIIPSPGGPIKIPLPIIWIPLVVIPTPIGLFVLFIGQCGICPSPFLLYVGTSGEKKFLVSLRPTQDFGSGASDGPIKDISKGGIATPTPTFKMLNAHTDKVKKYNDPLGRSFKTPTPESVSAEVDSAFADVKKAIEKLGLPKIPALPANASLAQKKDAARKVVSDHLSKLKVPDIKIPKNASKVNPKLPPVADVLGNIKRLSAIKMPNIATGTRSINVTDKLFAAVDKIDTKSINVKIPAYDPKVPSSKGPHEKAVKEWLGKAMPIAVTALTPEAFGLSSKTKVDLSIFIPFLCLPGIKGIEVPPIPGPLSAALEVLKTIAATATQSIDVNKITEMLGVPASDTNMKDVMKGVIRQFPQLTIPDPSPGIVDMIIGSGGMLSLLQVPAMPDPTKPGQMQITIPGEAIAAPLRAAATGIVSAALDAIPAAELESYNGMLTTILSSPVEAKQHILGFVEQAQADVSKIMTAAMAPLALYQKASNLQFPKLLGLKPQISVSDLSPVELTMTVTPEALKIAQEALKVLSIIPYPAVLLLPEVFKMLHPILAHDDMPPWERLSPSNFLFVVFLDQFCEQGKKGGGLLENP